MQLSKALLLTLTSALFTGLAQAQETPDGQVKVHVVQVGDKDGSLRFYPEELQAKVGELVQFQFWPRNHSVAQSTFNEPCKPIGDSASANGTVGFFSGFMPVTAEDEFMPTFTITVNQTGPIWYYCATGPHCQRGMAGVINPPTNNPERTLAKYKEAANQTTTGVPGGPPGQGGETDPDGPKGPETPTIENPPSNTSTTLPPPSNTDSAASAMGASAVSVVLGAIAVAFFLA
ncbi:Cupredoxin [Kalaharituber pfeilii]|nr:Cupredoxin [Kalaharituber pfeilii]